MALIIFLVSSTSDFIPGGLSQVTKINFWESKYFLAYILPNDLEWYINHDYGMYAEIYRWNLIIFWISLLSFLFSTLSNKENHIKSCFTVINNINFNI